MKKLISLLVAILWIGLLAFSSRRWWETDAGGLGPFIMLGFVIPVGLVIAYLLYRITRLLLGDAPEPRSELGAKCDELIRALPGIGVWGVSIFAAISLDGLFYRALRRRMNELFGSDGGGDLLTLTIVFVTVCLAVCFGTWLAYAIERWLGRKPVIIKNAVALFVK